MKQTILKEIFNMFDVTDQVISIESYGNGHINDTYRVITDSKWYILQKMNRHIFKNPIELMDNIVNITSYLKHIIVKNNGNPERETLNVIKTKDGKSFYLDSEGEYWRSYIFIEDAICLEYCSTKKEFYESAVAFGHFQYLLSDYPADTLHVTIDKFHDTVNRFNNLKKAIDSDPVGRVKTVQKEIEFALKREADAYVLGDMLERRELPLRVTHNDTKLNNIMFDKETGKGICVIDLDTVMPGLTAHDFGDAIRFGASTGAEDEQDLSKIVCSMDLYEAYMKGFIEGCKGTLTENEHRMLPMGAKIMTYECGMRFLTDYLEGDTYFKISREGHNLDRCRTQFKLVQDMESKWDVMNEIVKKYC